MLKETKTMKKIFKKIINKISVGLFISAIVLSISTADTIVPENPSSEYAISLCSEDEENLVDYGDIKQPISH